jgi:hypothetical protein
MPLWIKGNNAIVTRTTMPSWQRQGRLHINHSNGTIVTRARITMATMAKTPAHWWQQCHLNEGNNVSSTTSNEGNNASLITTEMPAHQQKQQPHRDKRNNRHCNNGKDACASMATMPAWQRATRATTLMTTTVPLQQGQQCQLEAGNGAITTKATTPSRIKGNDAIVTRATMPSWQWQGSLRIGNATTPSSRGQ